LTIVIIVRYRTCTTGHTRAPIIDTTQATGLNSFTLPFRQPVATLQMRYPSTNGWKRVKLLTVNACDPLQPLTAMESPLTA
jgi:hypothetical protein